MHLILYFAQTAIGLFYLSNHVCAYQSRSSGLSSDPGMGNDFDLTRFLQSNRVGKDCNGVDCDDNVVDDGCMCDRDCSKHPEPRTCYWKFFTEQYTSMGPACNNCSKGVTEDCYAHQCIVGDGREKTVTIINRMAPGPTISVCKNDLVVIDVINILTCQAVTIHWHGLRQIETPFMDGVPWVTQCPIPPMGQFRYKFRAKDAGTRWYHPHLGNTVRDFMNGLIRIKQPREEEPDYCDYDYDLACHMINVDDCAQFLFDYQWPGYWQNQSHIPMKAEGLHINGFGSFDDGTTKTITPHAQFHVKCGKAYRFRLVATLSVNCMFRLTIQDHKMKIIAFDGNFVKPKMVDSIVTGSGMRTDFILYTKPCNETGNCSYIMYAQPLDSCATRTIGQHAYLVYSNCSNPTPEAPANLSAINADGVSVDYVQKGCNLTGVIICSDEFESYEEPQDPRVVYDGKCENVIELVLGNHIYNYTDLFNNSISPYQPYYIPGGSRIVAETMNNISAMSPPCVLLPPNKFKIPENMFCPKKCDDFCSCIQMYEFKTGDCVEIRLNEVQASFNHPFHLHGHDFYVMKMGSPTEKKQPNFYENLQKTRYPVKRDTAMLMAGGFAVFRTILDNPGYWLFHCHLQSHMMGGMWVVIKVGDDSEMVPQPKNFPKCYPWLPPAYEAYSNSPNCNSSQCAENKYYGGTKADYSYGAM